jgi:hypothetical protein
LEPKLVLELVDKDWLELESFKLVDEPEPLFELTEED